MNIQAGAPAIVPGPARPPDALDCTKLAALLYRRGLIGLPFLQAERLAGGQSNPTYRISFDRQSYVLRTKPPGVLLSSAHAIDREYRVLAALQGGSVPTPRVLLYSDDASIVGRPFYVMEFLEGRVMQDPSLPGFAREDRAAIYREMNRVITALHRLDYQRAGLADYSRQHNYLARQIARWTRQCQVAGSGTNSALAALAEWLPRHLPNEAQPQVSLIHGDYRMDNLVFHPTEPRIIGVLDWELSCLGHPLADFAYHCMSWRIPAALWRGIGGLDLAALGIPDEAAYVGWYCEANGIQGIEHWDFYLAFNFFRLAAIMTGIARRLEAGNAAGADALETSSRAQPLAELGWQHAKRHAANAGWGSSAARHGSTAMPRTGTEQK